jgi:hypothetical protein
MFNVRTIIVSFLVMAGASAALAVGPTNPRQSFMPENRLHMQDRINAPSNVTEQMFNELIDQAYKIYTPIVAAHGGELYIDRNWKSSTVNAYANQEGKRWAVYMFGGLARREEVTPDGFALVICHELGHHLGGYSFKGSRWAANEGQSDYFATQSCARMLWGFETEKNQAWKRVRDVPATVQKNCDAAWKGDVNRGWCYRASAAGLSLANLLANLGGDKKVSFDTPDTKVVTSTNDNHPAGQCRLDTYFQGALCTRVFDPKVIPGKNDAQGQQSVNAESVAAKYTCFKEDGFNIGYRPNCWFKSARSKMRRF